MASLDEIYSAEWFAHDFEHLQPEFDVVADSLVREFGLTRKSDVVDLGCGPGMVVRRLRDCGISGAVGIEGSAHGKAYADESIRPMVYLFDITKMSKLSDCVLVNARQDLIICTEVAEHLAQEHADGLVKLLCSAMCPVVFTAAPPGQDGHHHVNCQSKTYWVDKFMRLGAVWDHAATDRLALRWSGLRRLSHMTNNVMVFS